MAAFIRCPECSFCIGAYADFVSKAKQSIYASTIFSDESKFSEYYPSEIVFNPKITPSLESLFDAVGIKNRCCRMHIVAVTEFDKMYK